MNTWIFRPCAVASARATTCRCASLGPISATDIPLGAPDDCGSAVCALVDISALAIMSLILLSFAVDASCRCVATGLGSTLPHAKMGLQTHLELAVKLGSGRKENACEPASASQIQGPLDSAYCLPGSKAFAQLCTLNSGPVTDIVTGP